MLDSSHALERKKEAIKKKKVLDCQCLYVLTDVSFCVQYWYSERQLAFFNYFFLTGFVTNPEL